MFASSGLRLGTLPAAECGPEAKGRRERSMRPQRHAKRPGFECGIQPKNSKPYTSERMRPRRRTQREDARARRTRKNQGKGAAHALPLLVAIACSALARSPRTISTHFRISNNLRIWNMIRFRVILPRQQGPPPMSFPGSPSPSLPRSLSGV